MLKKKYRVSLCLASVLATVLTVFAQDSNILYPIDEIEQMFEYGSFEIFRIKGSRFRDDITKRAILKYPSNTMVEVKWKRSVEGGWATNNQPRYEMAVYRLQKLFLDPQDYVVPPTVARAMPVAKYQTIKSNIRPTFKNTSDVIYVLQYWLQNVRVDKVYDKKRFESDSTYPWHFANMNILSYLIEHKDANIGNMLISTDPKNPRVFAVDNGFAFASRESERGTMWRDILVKRLPKKSLDRLRTINREALGKTLAAVAQFEMQDGSLRLEDPTEKLDKKKRGHQAGNIIQFGLTDSEIGGCGAAAEKTP